MWDTLKNKVAFIAELNLKFSSRFFRQRDACGMEISAQRACAEKRIKMLEFRYDTQLLIEGENLDEDEINDYFTNNFKGDCLLAVGDDELIKIHFHTNEPWKVLEYCSTLGEIYDIVVEDMDRQARGLKG